jgi:hypothetical protein
LRATTRTGPSTHPCEKELIRKIIEHTLVSIDGVFEDTARLGFIGYRDDAI